MENAAVSIGGEAFAALTVLFVLGMLAIAVARIVAKSRGSAHPRRRSDGDGGVVPGDGDRRSDQDGGSGDSGDRGGDGGGGGD